MKAEEESFRVFVRVRPLNTQEGKSINPNKLTNVVSVQDNLVHLLDPDRIPDCHVSILIFKN